VALRPRLSSGVPLSYSEVAGSGQSVLRYKGCQERSDDAIEERKEPERRVAVTFRHWCDVSTLGRGGVLGLRSGGNASTTGPA
jgi:hypothetical protein